MHGNPSSATMRQTLVASKGKAGGMSSRGYNPSTIRRSDEIKGLRTHTQKEQASMKMGVNKRRIEKGRKL